MDFLSLDPSWLAVSGLGTGVGLVMGLTGAGGGILAVPLLTWSLGWTMQQAAPVALLAVAVGAAIGAIDGFRHRLVRYKAAALMALCGLPMSAWGLRCAQATPSGVLKLLFAVLLLWVGTRLFRRSDAHQWTHEWGPLRLALVSQQTGRFIWTPSTAVLLACIGALTGFLSGLLGVGGGFFIVPMLKKFTELSMSAIVATSLFLIALVSGGGALNAQLQGHVWPPETPWFVGVLSLGVMLGRRISHRVDASWTQRAFSILLLVLAAAMLWQAQGLWRG